MLVSDGEDADVIRQEREDDLVGKLLAEGSASARSTELGEVERPLGYEGKEHLHLREEVPTETMLLIVVVVDGFG